MSTMTEPRKKPGRPKKADKPKRSGRNVNVWIQEYLALAMDRCLAETRPAPTQTAVIEDALDEYFRARGFLPETGKSEDA